MAQYAPQVAAQPRTRTDLIMQLDVLVRKLLLAHFEHRERRRWPKRRVRELPRNAERASDCCTSRSNTTFRSFLSRCCCCSLFPQDHLLPRRHLRGPVRRSPAERAPGHQGGNRRRRGARVRPVGAGCLRGCAEAPQHALFHGQPGPGAAGRERERAVGAIDYCPHSPAKEEQTKRAVALCTPAGRLAPSTAVSDGRCRVLTPVADPAGDRGGHDRVPPDGL